jgi:acyl-homoserine-lactone acylase
MMRCITLLLLLAGLLSAAEPKPTEILWDKFGTPHIFSPTRERMFYAHGWAQAKQHAQLLLRLYGISRGKAAEYWGESFLESDIWLAKNEITELGQTWYEAQTPEFRTYLDAFAQGINDYVQAHPEAITDAYRRVLPISGVDVVQHPLRAVHFGYMGSPQRLKEEVKKLEGKASASSSPLDSERVGSNTWAVAPSRSASKKAMLLINPHLVWEDFYTYMEVHLQGPDYDLYGAPQIGFPTPVIGFNQRLGWGRTVNTIDTVDFYVIAREKDGYLFDGKTLPFTNFTKSVKVRQADGKMRSVAVTAKKTIHGPVVYESADGTLAMRVAGLDRPRMLEQWFRMGEARNLQEFQNAMRIGAIPMWHASYADADGHIMFVFNGLVPKRRKGDFAYWNAPVPGHTSETLWTEYHSFDDLPKTIDPQIGFVQNANEPPWQMTVPNLLPTSYPSYMAPGDEKLTSFRTTRSLRMLSEDPSITYDEFVTYKHSTRVELADATLEDLLTAAKGHPTLAKAVQVLSQWDRHMEANSKGAVLFWLFTNRFFRDDVSRQMRVAYDPQRPLETPRGIKDLPAALSALESAAIECEKLYGKLDVEWGQVFRFRRADKEVAGNGGPGKLGLFRTFSFGSKQGTRYYQTHGETFVCAIEFGVPQRANCLLSYGNSSQPGSPHQTDQLQMLSDKKLHPVWRTRSEIEANLERAEALPTAKTKSASTK